MNSKDNLQKIILVVSIFAGVWLIGVLVTYIVVFFNHSFGNPEEWGEFGDYFGGMLNPVIALAALVALFTSIRIQQRELAETHIQLAESTVAQEKLVLPGCGRAYEGPSRDRLSRLAGIPR